MNHDTTLVVGDLHLHVGADPVVAHDLVRLLDAEANPGVLVLNGDVFDLDRVTGEPAAGVGAELARARVSRILEGFPVLALGLSRWAARNGRIVWLPGNHDAEICRPEVRELLRERLGLQDDRLCFEDRAYARPGLHVEHGNQYDPDNCFAPDTATAVVRDRLTALPLGCLVTRLLLGRIPAFENQGDNHQTPGRVLARVLRDYRLGALRMVALYFVSALRIAWLALRARRLGHATPGSTMASPGEVLRRMYLDRVLIALALPLIVVLGLAGVLAPASLPSLEPGAALAVGVPCVGMLLWRPARRRSRFRHRDRQGCLSAARSTLASGAGIVVMGHTHHIERVAAHGGVYLNTGAFDRRGERGRSFLRVRGERASVDFLG